MKTFSNLLLNIPHSSILDYHLGWDTPLEMFPSVKQLTDWHTDTLFGHVGDDSIRESIFPKSRFCVDVERLRQDPMESVGQGLIYTHYDGFIRSVDAQLRNALQSEYDEYHRNLASKVSADTLVIDCHSFPSSKSGEVDVCIGFNSDESYPGDEVIEYVRSQFEALGLRVGINNPYSCSICPETSIPFSSLMIEINKRIYMDEDTLLLIPDAAQRIRTAILHIYDGLLGR